MSKPADGVTWDRLRPRRRCAWEEHEGRVAVLVPRFGHGRLGRRFERLLRLRPYRLRLDELGTFVWERLDGERTVREIADDVERMFGEKARPAAERVVIFLRRLERGRLIDVRDRT